MTLQNLLLAFAITLFLPFAQLSANNHFDENICEQTIFLENNSGRKSLYLNAETEIIEICGLQLGEQYNFLILDENGCRPYISQANYPKNKNKELAFVADSNCAEIQISLQKEGENCSPRLTLSYSIPGKSNIITDADNLEKVLPPISVVSGVIATTLIEDVFIGGGCFEISNVFMNGNPSAAGIFSGGGASLGIAEGIILSSGNAAAAAGPNNDGSVSTNFGGPGDADLNQLQIDNGNTGATQDRISIEFDFTPTVDMIQFNYSFGSDEYCQWINSAYTDVFGFFISGPGIAGGYSLGAENIAVLPTTGEAVSINTVNTVNNPGFFIPNQTAAGDDCGGFTSDDLQYDGWTSVLTATANVIPCETYHIKLVLADDGDGGLDSGVFLEANSFSAGIQADGSALSDLTGTNIVYEQCPDGSFIFTRAPGSSLDDPIIITYTISGTATPGVDYTPLPTTITIPAGQVSFTLPVDVISDIIVEGQESIILTLDNSCSCEGLIVELLIDDSLPMEASMEDQQVCGTGSVTLSPTITGGVGNFTYMWDTGASGPSITVSPSVPTTYIVTVTDECMNSDTASATVVVSMPPTAAIDGMYTLCAGATPPTVDIPVTFTGTGPWTFTYSIGGIPQPPITTSDNPYFLTVVLTGNVALINVSTGAGSCPGTVMGSVTTSPITISASIDSTPEQCGGASDGTITVTPSGGTEPYSYNWSNGGPDAPTQTDVPAGSYTVIITDDNGCTTNASVTVDPATPLNVSLTASDANCTNGGNGNITLTVNGGTPSYSYAWSDGSSSPNLPNAPAGMYSVTVTDLNGCTSEAMTDVADNNTPPDAVANGNGLIDCNNETMQIDGNGSSIGSDITYQWNGPGIVSGGTTLSPTINAGGTYTIIVTDNNSGCTAEAMVDILEDLNEPNAVATLGPYDCATFTQELDGNGSSTGPEFTYQWSGPGIVSGGTTLNPTINQSGTYTILVTNLVNGCTSEASVSPNPPSELTASLTPIEANCTNNGIGNITLTVNGGTPVYSYLWSDGSTNPNLNAPAGPYSVTVTDDNGCTVEAMSEIADNTTPPDAVANGNGVIDCNNETMQIDGNGSSIGSNITYQWSGPGIVSGGLTLSPTINAGGTYMIIVTDNDSGCTAEAMMDILEDLNEPDAVATLGPYDCATFTQELDGNGSSFGPEFIYQWSGPGIVSGGTTLNPTINQSGTYTILVTNTVNGCTNEATVSPNPPSELTASLTPMEASCINGGFGNITLTVNGGTPNFSYLWSDGSTNPNLNAPPGSYSVTVTDDNGCTVEATTIIDDNTTPPIAVANENGVINCDNETIQIHGDGSTLGTNITYQWSGPGIVSGNNTLDPFINTGGIYTIIVTDNDSGCTAEAMVNVLEDLTPPDAAASGSEIDCNNQIVTVDGIGSSQGSEFIYQWSGPGIVSGSTTLTPQVNQSGTYTIVVTNTINGCTAEASTEITDNSIDPFAVVTSPNLDCTADAIELDGTGSSTGPNITYQWSGPGLLFGETTLMPTVDQPGTYELIVTNNMNGCTASTTTEVIVDDVMPFAFILEPPILGCETPIITLDGSLSTSDGNQTYEWSGDIITNQGTLMPQIIDPGLYTLIVTNISNGCTAEATIEVFQQIEDPDITIADPELLNCFNPEVTLDATGSNNENGTTYQWLNENGNEISGANDLIYTTEEGGTYTLIVTSSSGCTNEMSVTVDEDLNSPIADPGLDQLITCTESMVTLDGSNSSTGGNFDYEWLNSNGNVVENGLTFTTEEAGTYEFVVTDLGNGCTASEFVTVSTNEDVPTVSVDAPQGLDCIFSEITLNATTNSSDVTILWTTNNGNILNGENTLSPMIDEPGNYQLVITDNVSGCTAIGSAIVEESLDLPEILIVTPEDLDCTLPIAFLDAISSNDDGNFQYNWSTVDGNILSGQNTLTPEIDAGGSYTLTILNLANGCESSETVEVTDNTLIPEIEIDQPEMITCTVDEVQISANNSSTGSNLTYQWTTTGGTIVTNETTLNPIVGSAGTYTLVISNSQNGCSATESILVEADANIPIASAGPATLLDCITEEITLSGTASGGTNLTYQWTTPEGNILNGETTLSPTIDAAGTYTLTVINPDNNCETTSQVTIQQDVEVPTANAGANAILNCNNPTLNLNGNGSTNNPDLNIVWTTSDGNIVNGANTLIPEIDANGTYTLTISNPNNNCSATDNVLINQNFVTPTANAGAPQTMGCGVDDLELNGTANSTNNPFLDINWTTATGNILADSATLNLIIDGAGTYVLTVVDPTNGCSATASVNIMQNTDIPAIAIGPDGAITCQTTNLDLEATVTGNTNNFVYQWTTPDGNIAEDANTLTPNVDAAGTYQLVVTDTVNNCSDMAMLTVTEDADIPQAAILPAGTLSCNSTSVTLDASNSTTGANIIYEWTSANGNFTGGTTTLSPTIDAPGLYTLTVTDTTNNCVNTTGITVPVDTLAPTVMVQPDGVLTCQIEEINLSGSTSTTNGDLTYLWTTNDGEIINGEDGLTPLIGAAGTYTLTIVNSVNGCDNSANLLVEASADVPIIDIQLPEEITCLNEVINLDATNSDNGTNFSIEWTTANGNLVNLDNPLEPIVDASGIYNLLITNTLTGCSATQEVEVFENQTLPVAVVAEATTINCTEPTLVLNGAGSSVGTEISYTWTTADGNIIANTNSLNPTIDSEGIYQLVVTNSTNGCTAVESISVEENLAEPAAAIANPETLNCYQETVILETEITSQNTDLIYEWTTINGNILNGNSTLTPEVDENGLYQVLITDPTNGCTATYSTNVIENFDTPISNAGPDFELSCAIDNVILNGGQSTMNSEITYEWTSSNGNIISGQSSLQPIVNETGIYTLIVTNTESGCSAVSETEVTQDADLPNADAGTADALTCNVLEVALDGSNSDNGAGFTFEWSTTNGNFATGENTLTPTVDSPGIYVLTITNEANDCSTVSSVTVPENTTPPIADAGATEELSCDVDELSLDGGNSATGVDFSYEWTTANGSILNGENTLTPDINAPGTYQILVTNLTTGCTATDEVAITESLDVPIAAIANPGELTCTELQIALDANSSSQGTNITYEWSTSDGNILNGGNTATPTINEPGTYEILVTDTDNGCTNSTTVVVSEDVSSPLAEAGEADKLDCDTQEISLDGEGSATGPTIMYEWSTTNGVITSGANTLNPTVASVGVYEIEVMDMDNGCSSMDMVIVESNAVVPLTVIANPDQLTCTDEIVFLNGENSDTGPFIDFEWTTQGGNIINNVDAMILEVDAPGIYTLTVTNNENGCTETATVEVDEDVELPTAEAGESFTLDCLQEIEFLQGAADANGATVSINWTTNGGILQSGVNTLSPGISQAGVYTLTVTNLENGCISEDDVLIETDGPVGAYEVIEPVCYATPGAIAFQNIQGGQPPYVYSIDNGNTFVNSGFFPDLPAGQYDLIVQDANGCEHEETAQVTQPEEVIVNITVDDDEAVIKLGDEFPIIAQTTIPDSQIDTIIWTPGSTLSCDDCLTPIATPEVATLYYVVVTDHNGCSGEDALFLRVEKDLDIYAPNVFSPNGDGENEVFMLYSNDKSVKKIKSFLVFSRWGETVHQYYNFDPNQPVFGWDGTHRGEILNPAVFVWFAEVEFLDGTVKLFEGDVTLMR